MERKLTKDGFKISLKPGEATEVVCSEELDTTPITIRMEKGSADVGDGQGNVFLREGSRQIFVPAANKIIISNRCILGETATFTVC